MENYFTIKLNDGNKHVVYGEDDELEAMVKESIIKEYAYTLDNWNTGRIYDNYIQTELENKVDEICRHIQNVKGIKSGDVTPDLALDLDNAIESVCKAIMNIIRLEEELKNE